MVLLELYRNSWNILASRVLGFKNGMGRRRELEIMESFKCSPYVTGIQLRQ
jgi:hypothetical protein